MAVSVFPPASSGGSGGGNLTLTQANALQWYGYGNQLSAGVYSVTINTAGTYNFIFYNGAEIVTSATISSNGNITLTAPATIIRVRSSVANGSVTIPSSPSQALWAANMTIQTITSSQTVTLPNGGLVVALGGGGAGSVDSNGGGSGYLASGVLGAGSYAAVIGAGGMNNSAQGGATSIGNLVALGGNPNTAGPGGSGGGNYGSPGGIDGGGPNGSGVKISTSILGNSISWATSAANQLQGGGVYAGGGGGAAGNGGPGNSYGGGGGGGGNSANNTSARNGGAGFQGVIWIGTLN